MFSIIRRVWSKTRRAITKGDPSMFIALLEEALSLKSKGIKNVDLASAAAIILRVVKASDKQAGKLSSRDAQVEQAAKNPAVVSLCSRALQQKGRGLRSPATQSNEDLVVEALSDPTIVSEMEKLAKQPFRAAA